MMDHVCPVPCISTKVDYTCLSHFFSQNICLLNVKFYCQNFCSLTIFLAYRSLHTTMVTPLTVSWVLMAR